MRVLDAASDASAVLAEAAAKQADARAKRRIAPEPRSKGTGEAIRNDDVPDASERSIELDSVLDREQESESEIEDRDVPEDIDFEAFGEDEEEEEE
jgi:hypothetical protein